MNILIITTYYPPDTAIAAVRPYEFAKHLSLLGHAVTVLRPGFFRLKPNDSFSLNNYNIRVISYLGKNCDAEKYNRGEYKYEHDNIRFKFIKGTFRDITATVLQPYLSYRHLKKAKCYFKKAKGIIDNLSNEHFDIVFSSFGDIENIYIGQYAARHFSAKLIQDYRDPVVRSSNITYWSWNMRVKSIEKESLLIADLCTTVSNGMSQKYHKLAPNARVITLYNGYDTLDNNNTKESYHNTGVFNICYTGSADHPMTRRAMNIFVRELHRFITTNYINHRHIRFTYAGSSFEDVITLFSKYKLDDIIDNRGYVSYEEVFQIQKSSDLFLVLSWNTLKYTGVLTGKFYEGIRANKPILSVISGNLPNSDLKIINDKYNYGFCYEESNNKISSADLLSFIKLLFDEKMKKGYISYKLSNQLRTDFHYKTITKKLVRICEELLD